MKAAAWICFLSVLSVFKGDNPMLDNLQSSARKENKYIAVYFSGSDWCTNCAKFKKEILSDPVVDSLLHHRFIYYMADFPQRTKQADSVKVLNELLAEKLNPGGLFPVLVIADSNLQAKAKIYNGDAYATIVEQLKKLPE